jgi:hypothetical protein
MSEPDRIERRIVCEFGRQYAYVYMHDGQGKLLDEEVFKQPMRLEKDEAVEEASDAYQMLWQHLSDTIVFSLDQLQGEEGDEVDQE